MSKIAQLPLAVSLPDDETFASYISEVNRPLVSQLQSFIEQPLPAQQTGYYLFGLSNAGKSHLLHASCSHAAALNKSSLCLSCSEIRAMPVELLDNLEHIDLVCLDDIQLLSGDAAWQQAVFDLFNRLHEHGKQLLISGNESLAKLDISLPDLKSRLSWGHVGQLKVLSDEEKIAAIQYRAKQRGLVLQDDVAKFLLKRLTRDMSHLIYCLEQLDNASIREQRKLTIPFIKEVLPNI